MYTRKWVRTVVVWVRVCNCTSPGARELGRRRKRVKPGWCACERALARVCGREDDEEKGEKREN